MPRLSSGRVWPVVSCVVPASALLIAACAAADRAVAPASSPRFAPGPNGAATGVVVSQLYGAGGNAGATLRNDYVELYNAGTAAVTLTGWSLQYASATGTGNFSTSKVDLQGTIQPGAYFLVQLAGGANGAALPVTADQSSTAINMSGTAGKLALVNSTTGLACNGSSGQPCSAAQRAQIVDLVGYGNANFFEGSGAAPTLSATLAGFRRALAAGHQDTDNNAADFVTGAPAPRNSGTTTNPPSPVGPLDRVTVTPATASVAVGAQVTLAAVAEDAEGDDITAGTISWTDEDSPNVTVTPTADGRSASVRGDAAGGPARVIASYTENGVTRADTSLVTVTAAGQSDDIQFTGRLASDLPLPVGFSDQLFANPRRAGAANPGATVQSWASENDAATVDQRGVVTALRAGTMRIRATLSDGYSEAYELPSTVAQAGDASRYADPLQFGTPADASPADDFVLSRNGFVASYNRHKRTPNWTAYNLDRDNKGDIPGQRCDCFTFDPELRAAGFEEITTADYTGSGFDRGHMVVSDDRELGYLDQAQTYYLSNIIPQNPTQNQGLWGQLEQYLQDSLAIGQNRELFILTGPSGVTVNGADTVKVGGKIAVPTHTWKVALVLERDRGLSGVRTASDVVDVVAVLMPNSPPNRSSWRDYRVSVDAVEQATGYDFFSALPDGLEAQVEAAAPATRAVGIDVQPERISLSTTAAVNVILYSGPAFDAAAVLPSDLELVVDGGAGARALSRSTVRDYNGDGRADRLVGFSTAALRGAGLRAGSTLALQPAGAAPAFRGVDATPPVVVP